MDSVSIKNFEIATCTIMCMITSWHNLTTIDIALTTLTETFHHLYHHSWPVNMIAATFLVIVTDAASRTTLNT